MEFKYLKNLDNILIKNIRWFEQKELQTFSSLMVFISFYYFKLAVKKERKREKKRDREKERKREREKERKREREKERKRKKNS